MKAILSHCTISAKVKPSFYVLVDNHFYEVSKVENSNATIISLEDGHSKDVKVKDISNRVVKFLATVNKSGKEFTVTVNSQSRYLIVSELDINDGFNKLKQGIGIPVEGVIEYVKTKLFERDVVTLNSLSLVDKLKRYAPDQRIATIVSVTDVIAIKFQDKAVINVYRKDVKACSKIDTVELFTLKCNMCGKI